MDGEVQLSVDIPQELVLHEGTPVYNGIFNLWIGEAGELLTSGVNGLNELVDSAGQVAVRSMEALSYRGHIYDEVYAPKENYRQ